MWEELSQTKATIWKNDDADLTLLYYLGYRVRFSGFFQKLPLRQGDKIHPIGKQTKSKTNIGDCTSVADVRDPMQNNKRLVQVSSRSTLFGNAYLSTTVLEPKAT